jgi:hypothetical protein
MALFRYSANYGAGNPPAQNKFGKNIKFTQKCIVCSIFILYNISITIKTVHKNGEKYKFYGKILHENPVWSLNNMKKVKIIGL